jgi:hypothetical protein
LAISAMVSAWRHCEIELPILKQAEFELAAELGWGPPNPRGVEQRGQSSTAFPSGERGWANGVDVGALVGVFGEAE